MTEESGAIRDLESSKLAEGPESTYGAIAEKQWQAAESGRGVNQGELQRYAENGAKLDLIFNFMSGEPDLARRSPFPDREPEIFNEISQRFGIDVQDIQNSPTKWLDLSKRIKMQGSASIERELNLGSGSLTKLPIDSKEAQKLIGELAAARDIHEEYPRSLAKLVDKIISERSYMEQTVKYSDSDPSLASQPLDSPAVKAFFQKTNEHYANNSKDWRDLYMNQIYTDTFHREEALRLLPEESRAELSSLAKAQLNKGVLTKDSEALRQTLADKLSLSKDSSWAALAHAVYERQNLNLRIQQDNHSNWSFQTDKELLWPGLKKGR